MNKPQFLPFPNIHNYYQLHTLAKEVEDLQRDTPCFVSQCTDYVAKDSHFCAFHKYNGGFALSISQLINIDRRDND